MQDRRRSARHAISFPVRVKWKDDKGKPVVEEGLTENVGENGAYLPAAQAASGRAKVDLTVTENPEDEVSVTAVVIRLERNAAHPQVALDLVEGVRAWKKKVWEYAASTIAAEKPEEFEDW